MKYQIGEKQLLILLVFYSALALILAYIAQFGFGLEPCVLCLYQRKPFFGVIILGLVAIKFLKSAKYQKIIFSSCLLLLLLNAGIAAYHVGVEQNIFQGPTTCSSQNLEEAKTIEELQQALLETKAIRCDKPAFVFLGISMAGWNFIYCIGLVILSLVVYFNGKKTSD